MHDVLEATLSNNLLFVAISQKYTTTLDARLRKEVLENLQWIPEVILLIYPASIYLLKVNKDTLENYVKSVQSQQ